MTVRVKICGVTRAEDAQAAIAAGADFIGLNFYRESPRYLEIERALEIRRVIGSRALVVGVFVNPTRGYVEERRAALGLDMIQLSGNEDDSILSGWPVPTIATRRLTPDGVADAGRCISDYILYDAFDAKLFGGTGNRIPIDRLRGLDLTRAFIAGGLNPDNVAQIAALNPYAVDCASGVESAPGVKDHDKIRSFVANAKRAR